MSTTQELDTMNYSADNNKENHTAERGEGKIKKKSLFSAGSFSIHTLGRVAARFLAALASSERCQRAHLLRSSNCSWEGRERRITVICMGSFGRFGSGRSGIQADQGFVSEASAFLGLPLSIRGKRWKMGFR
ncbi:hypothetical protein CDAR_62601 [Caerostris darwini]|uniref:Uncharacterized protein n=1 Tax=Caerostris darwini TaxID=1538125 RepID=A0AAV4UFF7_9ARAC|nr:hypothetical protein CDAR_62601 [Caerostris darwini]